MTDLLLTLLVAGLLAVAACLVLVAVVVLPFVTAGDLADRRGFSVDRWSALAAVGIALGALVALWVLKGDHSRLLLLPAAALAWSVPGVLSLLDPGQTAIGGRQGRHLR